MLEAAVRVTNILGLHARAAAQLVRLAGKFKCNVTLTRQDTKHTADAKDILSVLYLAATCGVDLTITADGADESEAMPQIEKLFANKFGEE